MSLRLWSTIERVSALLEPAERQSVLGDIQERGADLRALFELVGLVLFRQVQAWFTWQPWLLTASLAIPMLFAARSAHPVAIIAHSGHVLPFENGFATFLVRPWIALAAPAFAWATGFTLGRIGTRRTASVVVILIALSAAMAYETAFQIFQIQLPPTWKTFFQLVPTVDQQMSNAVRRIAETDRFVFAVALMTFLIVIPCLHGWYRGQQQRPVSLREAVLVAGIALAAEGTDLGMLFFSPQAGLRLLIAVWPLAYLVRSLTRGRIA